jgi:hypothetical protein
MRVTLRFHVQSVTEFAGGNKQVTLTPSYKDGANKDWAKYTPSGKIELNLSQDAAIDFYEYAMRNSQTVGITMEIVADE